MNTKENKRPTLSDQIRDQIGFRILLTIFLSALLILFLTVHDYEEALNQIEQKLQSYCENMEDYVISQDLVSNHDAIHIQINHFNQQNPSVHFLWNPSSQNILKEIKFRSLLSWVYHYPLRKINGKNFGYFELSGSLFNEKNIVNSILNKIIFLFCFLSAILFILSPMIRTIPYKLFVDPINRLMAIIQSHSSSASFDETTIYCKEIEEIKNRLLNLIKKSEETSKKTALAELSIQVAHDIRSPLAALNVLVKQTQSIPENQRVMIRNAAQQINNIANNLLEQYRVEKNDSNTLSSEIISLLLDSVVSEKRAQYADSKIQLELIIDADSHGLFCNIIAADFKRVMSNLINNAVDAIQEEGRIFIHLFHQNNVVLIEIKDNGAGMSQALINKIMDGESVSSKKSGHGIGLISAKQMIESWSGNLTISSQLGKGTTLNIILPIGQAADWFADRLNFIKNSSVVILDDDQSIHDVWTSRLESEIPNANLTLQHYQNPQTLLDATVNENAIYLCDFELLGYPLTGLDVIEKLHLKNSVLVTSRYDEPEVRARCQKIGIKILPKSYGVHVPLIIVEPSKTFFQSHPSIQKPDLILIDDNKVLTDSWEMMSHFSNKNIVIFNSIKDANKNIDQYSTDTLIYVDSDLGENIKGEDFAKILYEKGYHNIYLATGHEPSQFDLKKLYWIKDIVGKAPNFDASAG